MKLVQTLVEPDEVDIVGAQIAYDLNAGVDFVIGSDLDSRVGTSKILEEYEHRGALHLLREEGELVRSRRRLDDLEACLRHLEDRGSRVATRRVPIGKRGSV
jgi:hypothetical protein